MQVHAYVEAFTARGVLLWREGDSLRYRAPAGVLTPTVLAKLKKAKQKILPVLPLAAAEHPIEAQQTLLEWALEESKKGTIPVLFAPLRLPSGNVVPPGDAVAWLLAAEIRAAGLALHAEAWPDCKLAYQLVITDMEALASALAAQVRS